MTSIILEACVDSYQSALNAYQAGAERLELCSELSVGGLTPSAGLIKQVRKIKNIAINVLIRPRSGDFCYSDAELDIMLYDIVMAKELGANGIVIGALAPDRSIDEKIMKQLIKAATPLSVTFHRAFDLVNDPFRTIDHLVELGVSRILTSGQAASANLGKELLKELHKYAKGKIIIMPGAGINAENVYDLVVDTGVSEIHASGKVTIQSKMKKINSTVTMGINEQDQYCRYVASKDNLQKILINAQQAKEYLIKNTEVIL